MWSSLVPRIVSLSLSANMSKFNSRRQCSPENSVFMRRFCIALCFFVALCSHAHGARYLAEVRDLRLGALATDGLIAGQVLFVFHDGTFDLFEPGQSASDMLAAFAGGGYPDLILQSAQSQGFQWLSVPLELGSLSGPSLPLPMITIGTIPPPDFRIPPDIDIQATPYVSYIGRLYPSDDLFFANDDPMRHRLVDDEGRLLGPLVMDIYGQDLLDAGVRVNDEQDLLALDNPLFGQPLTEALIRTEDEVVRPHPGFIGAVKQGEAAPGRLLGAVNLVCLPLIGEPCLDFAPAALDFTQAGFPLLRMQLTPEYRYLNGAWSGSYYDPARSGEGFSIDFIGEDPDQVVLYWYTYQPDGSGKQMWLLGQGQKDLNEARSTDWRRVYDYPLELFVTRGGRLTSTDNPQTVEVIPWGTARLTFSKDYTGGPEMENTSGQPACRELLLTDIDPIDDSIDLGLPLSPDSGLPEYPLVRLGGLLSGLEPFCGEFTAFPLPEN
mgnify:CR=1 FL=1